MRFDNAASSHMGETEVSWCIIEATMHLRRETMKKYAAVLLMIFVLVQAGIPFRVKISFFSNSAALGVFTGQAAVSGWHFIRISVYKGKLIMVDWLCEKNVLAACGQ